MISKLQEFSNNQNLKFLVFLLFFMVLSYWDLLKNLNSLTFGNDLSMNWAYFDFIKKSLSQYHQYPLWLPGLFSGFPLDSSNLAALFYPFHWVLILLPLKLGINLLTLTHIYLIGIAAYFLAYKGFYLTSWAAFLTAVTIMLSPKLMNHNYLGHLNLIESIPWLIFALLFFIISLDKKKYYFAICSGFFLALTITVFSIFYIYTLIALGIYFLVHLFTVKPGQLKTRLLDAKFFFTAFLASLFFSAVALLPLINFSTLSLRSRLTFWEGAFPSLFPDNLNQLFFPLAHRFHDSETLIYIGLPTLLLAFLALFRIRDKKIIYLIILALFTITVALGANTVFYKIYYRILPFFHFMRAPLRIWILFIISLSLLSGVGGDLLMRRFPRKKSLFLVVFIPLVFISLYVYNRDYFKLVDYQTLPDPISTEFADKSVRIYCLTNCLVTPSGLVNNLKFSSGGEVVLLNNYYDFMKVAGGYKFSGYSLSIPPYQVFDTEGIYFEKQNPNSSLLGLSNTKYVISPYQLENEDLKLLTVKDNYYLYENLKNLPRLFSIPNAIPFEGYENLKQVDFKKGVVVKGLKEKESNPGEFQEQIIAYYSPNQIKASVNLKTAGFLILSDTYYPDWQATIDNKKATILEANGSFRALKINQGTHEVVFSYFPARLKWGILVSMLSLFIFLTYSLIRGRRRRSKVLN